MFSGIIQATARVEKSVTHAGNLTISVRAPRGWRVRRGESIAVDGICSTVTKSGKGSLQFDYMPETLEKTTAHRFVRGTEVNLERSMKYGDRIDGHFVAGHVDTRGEVIRAQQGVLTVKVPQALMRLIATKGSVALNGVALTVTEKSRTSFSVALISYTLAHTNLGRLAKGSIVNIEVDLVARYLDVLLKKR